MKYMTGCLQIEIHFTLNFGVIFLPLNKFIRRNALIRMTINFFHMAENNKVNPSRLRKIALAILLIGAVGSLFFMFHAGSKQKSIVLLGLFTIWVISPFVGLFLATRLTKRWSEIRNRWFFSTMIFLNLLSLVVYSGLLLQSLTKPAFIFLIFPLLSWLAIITFLYIAQMNLKN